MIERMYDHPWCFGHSMLGATASVVDPALAIGIALAFVLYELNRDKTEAKQMMAIGEFAIGFTVAKLAHAL